VSRRRYGLAAGRLLAAAVLASAAVVFALFYVWAIGISAVCRLDVVARDRHKPLGRPLAPFVDAEAENARARQRPRDLRQESRRMCDLRGLVDARRVSVEPHAERHENDARDEDRRGCGVRTRHR